MGLCIWIIIQKVLNLSVNEFRVVALCDHLWSDRQIVSSYSFKIYVFALVCISILRRTS